MKTLRYEYFRPRTLPPPRSTVSSHIDPSSLRLPDLHSTNFYGEMPLTVAWIRGFRPPPPHICNSKWWCCIAACMEHEASPPSEVRVWEMEAWHYSLPLGRWIFKPQLRRLYRPDSKPTRLRREWWAYYIRQFPWVAWVGRWKDEKASWTCSPDAECGKPAVFCRSDLLVYALSWPIRTCPWEALYQQRHQEPKQTSRISSPAFTIWLCFLCAFFKSSSSSSSCSWHKLKIAHRFFTFPPNRRGQRCIGVVSLKEKVEKGDALSPHLLAIYQMNYATLALNHWQLILRLYYSITFITRITLTRASPTMD